MTRVSTPRAVVTGVGFACPLGIGTDDVFARFVAGEDGFRGERVVDHAVARCELDDVAAVMGSKREARRSDRMTHLAVAAADAAVAHSGIDWDRVERDRAGAVMGTAAGGVTTMVAAVRDLDTRGPDRVSPFLVPMFMPNALSSTVALRYGIGGPNFTVVTACASGANAVGEALQEIRAGRCDVVLAGGSEAATEPVVIASFANLGTLTRTGMRPFDLHRDGFAMGEGSAVLVLESEEHARARDARILCEVAGYGCTADAYHMTAPHPDGDGAVRALAMALDDAGLDPADVGYVNAHGTSTPLNDASEAAALTRVFGDAVPPVSSTKSMVGHLLGAAGALEAGVTAMALAREVLPPTLHYETPDPAIELDVVPGESRDAKGIDAALSNSFGFGGHNTVLAFRSEKALGASS